MDVAIAVWCEASRNDEGGGRPAARRFVVVRADDSHSGDERATAAALDRELLHRIQQDDDQALDQLLQIHADGLARYASTIVGRMELAQDVVQDVFIKLWETRHDLGLTGHVGGYLLRMTRNRALNVVRHERSLARVARDVYAEVPLVQVAVHNAGEAELDTADLARIVRRAVAALSPRAREVLLMRRQSGMSAAAVAAALDISVAAVHVQLSRALHRIAREIGESLG